MPEKVREQWYKLLGLLSFQIQPRFGASFCMTRSSNFARLERLVLNMLMHVVMKGSEFCSQ